MTPEKYEAMKADHIDYVTNYIKKEGNIFPCITIIADKINADEDEKSAIIHMPIGSEFLESSKAKDDFVDNIIPKVFKEVKQDFIPYATIWVAESWVRRADKDFDFDKEDFTTLPISKEVVFILIETKDKEEAIVLEIKRSGMQVNEEGNMVDKIDLVPVEEYNDLPNKVGGRFSGLFKIFDQT